MAFSDNLRKARKHKSMSQAALSGITGVSVAAICKYEKGTMLPTVIIAAELAKALNVTMEFLVYGKEANQNERKQAGDM